MTTHDYRSPAEIEREIELERQGLSGTLDELQHRFSIDRMTNDVGEYVRDQSSEILGAVSRAVRENPMAIALTGAGIAWMILGSRRNGSASRGADYDDSGYYEEDFDDDQASSTVGRSAYPNRAGSEDRYAGGYYDEGNGSRAFAGPSRDNDPEWVRGYADVLGTPDDMVSSGSNVGDGKHSSSSTSDRMKEGFRRAGERMHEGMQRAGEKMHETREDAETKMERARRRLDQMRERLAHGTEDLSEEGRRRVLAAREKAMEARHHLARQWSRQRRAASGMYDRQPLAAGALAFAAGAALAAALPRTRTEDAYLGEYSDELMQEAERIFEEERAKVGRVARATADEAKSVLNEKADEAKQGVKAAQGEAREGAERVANRAKEEAEKQNLGKPGK